VTCSIAAKEEATPPKRSVIDLSGDLPEEPPEIIETPSGRRTTHEKNADEVQGIDSQ
jgi:hypothetical protein